MLRAVLVGCGMMSHGWLKAAATIEGLEIVGLVDLDIERALALATTFDLGEVAIGADLDFILAATRPDLLFDVVIPAARRDVVAAGFAHGCHVLSEKPMAETMAQAHELLDISRTSRRLHAIVQNRRYVPGIRRLRHFIDSGAIGRLTAIHCDFFIGPHFGGFREQGLDAVCEFLHSRGFAPGQIVNTLYSVTGKLLVADILFSRSARSKLWMSL